LEIPFASTTLICSGDLVIDDDDDNDTNFLNVCTWLIDKHNNYLLSEPEGTTPLVLKILVDNLTPLNPTPLNPTPKYIHTCADKHLEKFCFSTYLIGVRMSGIQFYILLKAFWFVLFLFLRKEKFKSL
jgi:hypothetical protein